MKNDNNRPFEDMSHYELLQTIYNGSIDSKNLPKKVRQALVQILILRGQEKIAIAKILKVTDRTIRRDVEEIWEQNAFNRDPEFTRRFVGEIHTRAMSFVEMLTRMAHSTDASMNERSLAAVRAWQSLKGLFEKLHSLGYLPLDSRQAILHEETSSYPQTKQREDTKLSKKEEQLMEKIKSLPPLERDRLRRDLQREIMEIAKEDAVKNQQA